MSIVPPRWRGMAAGLAAAMGIGGATQAETPAPRPIPAPWIIYAEQATDAIVAWLSDDAEASARLRSRALAERLEAGQSVSLRMKVWIGADGSIIKVRAMDPLHPVVTGDLDSVLVGRRLSAPPLGMAQPLRLAIELTPRRLNE